MSKPVKVAVIGGGCASVAAAFELTRPEHRGRYQVTIYQLGWRLGGKGASGRGPADRIEEHGLHLWMGHYENAFSLLRECYAENRRDPATYRFAHWQDAFFPDPKVCIMDDAPDGSWELWTALFPTNDQTPGDPANRPPIHPLRYCLSRTAELLSTLILSARDEATSGKSRRTGFSSRRSLDREPGYSPIRIESEIQRILGYGQLITLAGLVEAIRVLKLGFDFARDSAWSQQAQLVDLIGMSARSFLETLLEQNREFRRFWALADMSLAIMRGILRFGLLSDPRGLDAINDFDFRQWLEINGASERTLRSSFLRALYDLSFSYENGDQRFPAIAAGIALRNLFRMFFSYRGSLFWKMRAGMGDVVFAPLYEVLKKRGARFRFFHRLENVRLADHERLESGESPYVEALEFDVQADIKGGGEYSPLIDVRGLPCWPASPDWDQLVNGRRLQEEGLEFESHWDRRRVSSKTLKVTEDFDCVVLGVGLGMIPFVCRDFIERDRRWRAMVDFVGTTATQAFQLWLRNDMEDLGWRHGSANLTGYVKPFDTWANMSHLVPEESWAEPVPKSIAYFCNVLPTPEGVPDLEETEYPRMKHEHVRQNIVRFLNQDIGALWRRALRRKGRFRWDALINASPGQGAADRGEDRLASQYWRANVHPSDRYVLSLPGTDRFRISPLDNTYDNLTITGDWTDCGYNQGCVEAAIMSGRVAAQAISGWPRLEDISGYDHP